MIEQLIAKYEPINTTEKVDALVSELKTSGIPFTSAVQFNIVLHIKKAKIQMYFREVSSSLPLQKEQKANTIINKNANKVAFSGSFNVEFIGSDSAPVKQKYKSEARLKREQQKAEEKERRKVERAERRKKRGELKRKLAEEKYKREHEFSPQFGCVIKKNGDPSKGLFDPNNDDYRKIAEKARSSQVIRNYDGKKSSSVHMMFIPSGGQNKKY